MPRTISQYREQLSADNDGVDPYADLTDQQFAARLHQRHYSDVPFESFAQRVGLQGPQLQTGETGSYAPAGPRARPQTNRRNNQPLTIDGRTSGAMDAALDIAAPMPADPRIAGAIRSQQAAGGDSKPTQSWGQTLADVPTQVRATAAKTIAGMQLRDLEEFREKATPQERRMGYLDEEVATKRDIIRKANLDLKGTQQGERSLAQKGMQGGATSLLVSLPSLVLGILTRNPALAVGPMMETTGGASYADLRDENIDRDIARKTAAIDEIIEVGTELAPAAVLFKQGTMPAKRLVNFLAREIPGESVATIGQELNNSLARLPQDATAQDVLNGLKAGFEQLPETWAATVAAGGAQAGIVSLAERRGAAEDGRQQDAEIRQPTDEELQATADRFSLPPLEEQRALPPPKVQPDFTVTPEGYVAPAGQQQPALPLKPEPPTGEFETGPIGVRELTQADISAREQERGAREELGHGPLRVPRGSSGEGTEAAARAPQRPAWSNEDERTALESARVGRAEPDQVEELRTRGFVGPKGGMLPAGRRRLTEIRREQVIAQAQQEPEAGIEVRAIAPDSAGKPRWRLIFDQNEKEGLIYYNEATAREDAVAARAARGKPPTVLGQPVEQPGDPTEGQAEAGNYKKPLVRWQEMPIRIENLKDSVREGPRDENGEAAWRSRMGAHYGYIQGSKSTDKEGVDIYLGEDAESTRAFVIDQLTPDGQAYDEAKVVVGVPDEAAARALYLSNYPKGWKGLGAITEMAPDSLSDWAYSDAALLPVAWKPAEAKTAQKAPETVQEQPAAERDSRSEERDSRLEGRADQLRHMATRAGWQEVGGQAISVGDATKAEVVGRTKWLPYEDWFPDVQRAAPLTGNKAGKATAEAVRKALEGEKLNAAERKHITAMLDRIDRDEQELARLAAEGAVEEMSDTELAALEAKINRLYAQPAEGGTTDTEEPMFSRKDITSGDLFSGEVPETPQLKQPASKAQQTDLFGAPSEIQQLLAKVRAEKERRRTQGQRSVETGRPDDLFSQAAKQVDVEDKAREDRPDVRGARQPAERDRPDTEAEVSVEPPAVLPEPAAEAGRARPPGRIAGAARDPAEGRPAVPRDRPVVGGERGNLSFFDSEGRFADPGGAARDPDARGSAEGGREAVADDRQREAEAVEAAEAARPRLDHAAKLRAQRQAEPIPVELANAENIAATLPYLLPSQHEDVATAERRFQKPDGYGMLFTNGTGTGKCIRNSAPVLTPAGWRPMGDIHVGDEVIAADGLPTRVLGVYPQGVKKMYRVLMSDGASTETCDEHLWETQTLYERRKASEHRKKGLTTPLWQCAQPQIRSLREIMSTLDKRHFVPIVEPVQFAEKRLPVDPYLIGVLIGDGCLTQGEVRWAKNDQQIAARVRASLPFDMECIETKSVGKCTSWSIRQRLVSGVRQRDIRIKQGLLDVGLLGKYSYEKFIPQDYLFGSVEQRVALLQGLMDTDGYADHKCNAAYYCTTSAQLADDVTALIRSLGGIVTRRTKYPKYAHNGEQREGRLAYDLCVRLPNSIEPFSLERKRLKTRSWGQPKRAIVNVEFAGEEEATCILVENPRHLFVVSDFILTHNTYLGLGIAKRFVKRGKTNGLIVVPSQKLAEDWTRAGKNLGLDLYTLASTEDAGRGLSVTTYANFAANRRLADRNYDFVLIDEAHNLMQNEAADMTAALYALRATTNHPAGAYDRAAMIHRGAYDRWQETQTALAHNQKALRHHQLEGDKVAANEARLAQPTLQAKEQAAAAAWNEVLQRVRSDVEASQGAARSRVMFLSATPFAYEKNVKWGEGYLYEFPEPASRGYNTPDGFGQFMMQHFGYRMRTGKLTEPEAEVDRDLMQRSFNSHLRKEGVLAARTLEVDADYDRKFVHVESKIGNKIDEGLTWLRENKQLRALYDIINKRFDYLARQRLLQALKAQEAVGYIQAQHALGRKVVVFYDYNEGGAIQVFDLDPAAFADATAQVDGEPVAVRQLIEEFRAARPDLVELDTQAANPLITLKNAFPQAREYNGRIPTRQRTQFVDAFNNDDLPDSNLILAQKAANAGWSAHDTSGKHQRVLINLGLPTAPTVAIQQEGRIFRVGNVSDAVFRYFNTGTSWERIAFAGTIARRAATAENLAMGEQARGLKDAFIQAFEDADTEQPSAADGKGGKARDRALVQALSPFDRAVALYFATEKKTSRTKAREGTDYFATPEPLGYMMVQWGRGNPGDSYLEPSAGHGAIARWFPDQSKRHVIEPSFELASRLALATDATLHQTRFEDWNIVNKVDVIVMNPPFGSGGSTAVKHIEKATKHLNDGGRIVALIPEGTAANKKFDKWYDEQEGMYLVRDIGLPTVAFERAGTAVKTRIVVLDKLTKKAMESGGKIDDSKGRIEMSGETIKEFFAAIENMEAPARVKLADEQVLEERIAAEVKVIAPATDAPPEGLMRPRQFQHTKTGANMYIAEFTARVDNAAFQKYTQLARKHGGYWNRYVVPGFSFKTPEIRDAFVAGVNGSAAQLRLAPAQGGQPASAVRAEVDRFLGKFQTRPNVIVVQSFGELSDDVQAAVRRAGSPGIEDKVDAFHLSGSVYFIADKVRSLDMVPEKILHEFVTHYGLKAMIPDAAARNEILDGVARDLPMPTRRYGRAYYGNKYDHSNDVHRRRSAEEVIAYYGERYLSGQSMPTKLKRWLDRVILALRDFMRDVLGLGPRFDERFVRVLLQDLQAYLMRGGDTITPMPDTSAAASAQAPTFYSALLRAAENVGIAKAPAQQWLNTLRNVPGVKAEEIAWVGLEEWLQSLGRSATKAEVVDFLVANQIEVQDVVKGGAAETSRSDRITVELTALGYTPTVYDEQVSLTDRDGREWRYSSGEEDWFIYASPYQSEDTTDWRLPEQVAELADKLADIAGDPELLDIAVREEHDVRYGQYTLPGGENYRELLLTLPPRMELPEGYFVEQQANGQWGVFGPGPLERNRYGSGATREEAISSFVGHGHTGAYRSGHWNEPNILAHVRFNERTDADGRRTLFIEEIQSDFAQDTRKAKLMIVRQVKEKFDDIVNRMKAAGVLEVNCD